MEVGMVELVSIVVEVKIEMVEVGVVELVGRKW